MGSTLDGAGKDRTLGRGHGTGALGPSDTSDTGSDIQGGPGLVEGDVIGLNEAGTTSDEERGGRTAGPDIGDADLDSDTDSRGTGERRAAGRDPDEPADLDRGTDRIEGSAGSPSPAAVSPDAGDEGGPDAGEGQGSGTLTGGRGNRRGGARA